jgi:hypothetical protein
VDQWLVPQQTGGRHLIVLRWHALVPPDSLLSDPAADLDLYLFASDGRLVAQSTSPAGDSEEISFLLLRDVTYTVQVQAFDTGDHTNVYSLSAVPDG